MKESGDVLFGINPVREKLSAAPQEVCEILLATEHCGPSLLSVREQAARLGVKVRLANRGELDRLAGSDKHQGVVAKVSPYEYCAFSNLLQACPAASSEWILILDGITDPRNFGALLRTAEAVGVRGVVIPKDRSVEVTPTVIKASAGAAHHLPVSRVTNLRRAMTALKENGYWLVGLDHRAPESIYERNHTGKLGIVLGSEGAGIRPLLLRECDYRTSIPMFGKVSSLNVSVAGAVFLYELLRQRRSVDNPGPKR